MPCLGEGGFLNGLFVDLRLSARVLAKSPGFTTAAVRTLALGIGANTALFRMLDAVLLKALRFSDPDRLFTVWGENAERTATRVPTLLVEPIRERAATIEAISTRWRGSKT